MRNTITAILFGLTVGAATLGTGCSKDKKEITCEQVTDHFLELAPQEMKPHLGDKKKLVESCEKKTSLEERKCIMGSKDFKAIMSCRKKKATTKG